MILQIKGDFLGEEFDIIAHQVNCIGVMDAGVALQIAQKYPAVKKLYQLKCEGAKESSDLLGTCQITQTLNQEGPIKYVANLYGQDGIGRGEMQTDYDALEKSLIKLREFAKENKLSIGIPYGMGCGLAGGDWEKIEGIIMDVFDTYKIIVVESNKG